MVGGWIRHLVSNGFLGELELPDSFQVLSFHVARHSKSGHALKAIFSYQMRLRFISGVGEWADSMEDA